jgi:hypothetical protein
MNLKRGEEEAVVAYFKVLSQHCLKGLRKTTKNLSQGSQCLGHLENTS